MNETGLSNLARHLKPWRGLIISLICSAFLMLFFEFLDRSRHPAFWEYLVFVVGMFIGWAGMILFFIDWWKRDKADAEKRIREFEELEKRKSASRR